MAKKKKENRYLVGYKSDNDIAYGNSKKYDGAVLTMTRNQAKKELDNLLSHKSAKVIYKLIPVFTLIPQKKD